MTKTIYDSSVIAQKPPFRFEKEMVKPIVSYLPTVFELQKGQRARLLREQPVGSVIPDLMFGIWTGELPRFNGLNPVSRQMLAWLSTEKKVLTEQHLRDELFLSERAAGNAVTVLQRVGAVSKRSSGELELRPEFNPSDSLFLIAIEMKLKRWREALAQAIHYRSFANESYVALDGNQFEVNATVRGIFVSSGVGLFIQTKNEIVKAIPAQMRFPEPSVDRLLAVSKFASNGPYCFA
jgi:hypothetical protein